MPNIHVKRSGDRLRAGEGGQEEAKKIGTGLEIAWKERACGKGVKGCLFRVSPKQQGTKSAEMQGKKNNRALKRNVNYVSELTTSVVFVGFAHMEKPREEKNYR